MNPQASANWHTDDPWDVMDAMDVMDVMDVGEWTLAAVGRLRACAIKIR